MTAPQQPYPYPPQQPPKKSWFARHKILTVLGALVVLVIVISVASGGGGKKDSGGSAGGGTASEPDPGIGQPVRDGKFEFVVVSVEPGPATIGGQFVSEAPQGEFLLVKLTVRNIADEPKSFTMSAQKLFDGEGREFAVDDMATIVLDQGVSFEEINPGNAVDGTIVFDVPVGTVASSIELHDSHFSGGTTVALR